MEPYPFPTGRDRRETDLRSIDRDDRAGTVGTSKEVRPAFRDPASGLARAAADADHGSNHPEWTAAAPGEALELVEDPARTADVEAGPGRRDLDRRPGPVQLVSADAARAAGGRADADEHPNDRGRDTGLGPGALASTARSSLPGPAQDVPVDASKADAEGDSLPVRTILRRDTSTRSPAGNQRRKSDPNRPSPLPNATSGRAIPRSSLLQSSSRPTDCTERKIPRSLGAGNNNGHTMRDSASRFHK